MWQELVVVHRRSGDPDALPASEGRLWRTCLRELLFLDPGAAAPAGSLRGLDAHRFLVEICSGLHSPLFGETEVFGQFRAFREAQPWHPSWESLLDACEEDVRRLRSSHLVGLGSQSYGSLARRHLSDRGPVLLLGGGRLARDLLPWLEGKSLTLALRSPGKWAGGPHTVLPLDDLAKASPTLAGAQWILAAPVGNDALRGFWEANPPALALDFRGESQVDDPPCPYLSLRALYAELESARLLHERKRGAALRQAAALSAARAEREARAAVHRPYGWEDAYP